MNDADANDLHLALNISSGLLTDGPRLHSRVALLTHGDKTAATTPRNQCVCVCVCVCSKDRKRF